MRGQRGYLIVLFVIVLAFVAIAASMHVLVLTSVATASRAYDSFRQASRERLRLQAAVAETILDQRQASVSRPSRNVADMLAQHLADLTSDGNTVSATEVPATVPAIVTYPDSSGPADLLAPKPAEFVPFLTPELAALIGARAAIYPESVFRFTTQRTVFETTRTYATEVRARLIAVPLTRYSIAAYELPADIGSAANRSAPMTAMPAGLVPSRDPAFIADLQPQAGVLPYHYRRRAALSAAYQYVFSQSFIDRVSEYAGIAHYCNLAASSGTASLAGLRVNGTAATWDLAQAGYGTFGTITTPSEASVVFTESGGYTLQIGDSAGDSSTGPLFLLVLGPSNTAAGVLDVTFGSIARPIVFIGFNVRVTATAAASINGALFLDPQCSFAPAASVTVGHLSYWAGSTGVNPMNVATMAAMPASAEALAPRVVYVATTAQRL